ncbi:MAG: hypothetical protein GC181_11165 [Bacteroidetes bacterium]|nr:hypothetical protein [Bacteroidota bacterium]
MSSPKTQRFLLLFGLSLLMTSLVFGWVRDLILGKTQNKNRTEITFAEDVAPILYDHCVRCHHKGGIGPFPLTTYEEVLRKKRTIRKAIANGIMPPWPADPEYTHFVGENYLTQEEKNKIFKWIDGDQPKGNMSQMPELPEFNPVSMLGKPDKTIYMDSIFVPGKNRDLFLSVKVPFEIDRDTFIRAIEFVTGEHNIVHHLNGHLLNYDFNRKKNVFAGRHVVNVETDGSTYDTEMLEMQLTHDDGDFRNVQKFESAINYLPGVEGTMYPEGIGGFPVSRKSTIFVQSLHYAPTQEDMWDRSHFNIFYSKSPPGRPTQELMLGTNGLSAISPPLVIPPDTIITCTTKYRLNWDASVLTINPHMHLLGSKFLAYGVTLQGDTIPLIRINRWDFRWQYFYTFKNPVHLPKGTLIVAEATFDNTSENPNNPYDPPQEIKERYENEGGSMRTTDEMFQFIITYLPYKKGDENISLGQSTKPLK